MKMKKVFEKVWGENSVSIYVPATLTAWLTFSMYVTALVSALVGKWDASFQMLVMAMLADIRESVRKDDSEEE